MKFAKLFLLVALLVPVLTNGQKIKYKDLFPLLSAGSYTAENEKTLKTFLANEKKPHANGNLHLGYILEKRFNEMDILADTTLIDATGDSAIAQLNMAKGLIDEKELKNDEYYQTFYRRDLRTGEFGIKLSDVHLEIEKKIETIEARKASIRNFNTLLHRIQGRNNLSAGIYQQIVTKGVTMRDMLFALTDDDFLLVERLIDNAKGLYVLADDLKESARELGSDYYQSFKTFKIIENHGIDGIEQSDVFSGELDLWDYETWASAVKAEYNAVKGYKNDISAKSAALDEAFKKVEQGVDPGSISVDDLTANAQKYDPDGSALSLLNFRRAQLEVSRLSSPAITPAWQDSLNVFAQLDAAGQILEELGSMTTIYSDLSAPEKISVASNRYPGILDTYYGGTSGYSEFVQNLSGWLNSQKIIWASRSDALILKDRYATSAEEKIPLFVNNDPQKYMTLITSGEIEKVAAGFDAEAAKGFVVWSGAARTIDAKLELDLGTMTLDSLVADAIPTTLFSGYFFDPKLTENNLFIFATKGPGQIKWTNLITAPNAPVSFRYDEMLDQLTVFYYPQDQLPGDGVTAYIVIDRTGTVR